MRFVTYVDDLDGPAISNVGSRRGRLGFDSRLDQYGYEFFLIVHGLDSWVVLQKTSYFETQ